MINSFLNRAKENFQIAELALSEHCYNASANRAYYCIFHIILAFLLKKGLNPKIDHKNVLSLFSNEFINKRKYFSSDTKRDIYKMQDIRNMADYQNGVSKDIANYQIKLCRIIFKTMIKELES